MHYMLHVLNFVAQVGTTTNCNHATVCTLQNAFQQKNCIQPLFVIPAVSTLFCY